tara:strand:+ start:52 stop:1080 length:1029 start_codon:yes stop_codon:yes gene_type:complete
MAAKLEGPSLKPTAFNLDGKYSSVRTYRNALLKSIDKRMNEFNMVHPEYGNYLKFLANEADGGKSFPKVKDLIKRLKEVWVSNESSNCLVEIKKYYSEVVGPISVVEDPKIKKETKFTLDSSVEVPSSVSQSGYDFSVGGTEITVKMPSTTTNTLKPGDIVRNTDLKTRKRFFELCKSAGGNIMLLYDVFEVLEETPIIMGAYTVIYGTTGTNGVLSKQIVGKRKEQDSALIPGSKASVAPPVLDMYANALEKQIEFWSKSIKEDMIEFTNLYYRTKKLFAFSYNINASSGKGIPSFEDKVKDAWIMGKGRAGKFGATSEGDLKGATIAKVKPEKLGIQMKF